MQIVKWFIDFSIQYMYIQFVNPIPDDILKPFPSPSHLEFIAVELPFDVKSLVSRPWCTWRQTYAAIPSWLDWLAIYYTLRQVYPFKDEVGFF